MTVNVDAEVAALRKLASPALRQRYSEQFGEETTSGHRIWLIRRIVWRLQELAEGGLSERARQRAAELAQDADLRIVPPRVATPAVPLKRIAVASQREQRLPPPGTVIVRPYKGRTLQVEVLSDGFAFEGQKYATLSAVAVAITGSHCNGWQFFRLQAQGGTR